MTTTGQHRLGEELEPAALVDRDPPPDPTRPHGPLAWLGNRVDLGVLALLGGAAAALRFVNIGRSYDVFVDELFYNGLGTSAGHGHIPPHEPPGWGSPTTDVFLLHPPGYFVLLGIWQHITGTGGDVFHQIYLARGLNAVLGALSVGLIFLIGRRLAGRWVGIAAAVIFALDPFILRQNGRVLLETATMFWVLAGYFVLIGLAQGRYRRPRAASVTIGLLFGFAILTKDNASLETVGAVLVLAALGWGIPRRNAVWVAVVATLTYSTYVVTCLVEGHGGQLWDAKTLGLRRQLGLVQTTGFNRPGSVSLSSTLWSEISSFAFTYLLVALGVVGAVYLLRSRRDDYHVLGVFVAAATAFMAYAGLFGTIEEQFLYLLFVPAVLSVTTVSAEIWRGTTLPGRRPSVASIALVTVFTFSTLWNAGVWAHTRSTPDNATQAAVAWLKKNASHGGPFAVTTGAESYALPVSGLPVVVVSTPTQMATSHVRYLILSTKTTENNYSFVTPKVAGFFQQHSRIVFTFRSSSQGELDIYETNDPSLW